MSIKNSNTPKAKGRKFIPALCNVLGVAILLFTIVISLPLALPRFLGYDVYNVVSGSMQPAIPIGSVIYVQPYDPVKIKTDDVIAFYVENTVIVHRVMENKHLEGVFITKGDANPVEDLSDVPYHDVIGKVVFHVPYVGDFLSIFSTTTGKVYVLLFAMCGILFNILAGRLRNRSR
ncbi:MAG: signal peptidase I [Firmicutes bacterium]|nr:signal peptidase I [Bacillota bacterium]